MIAGLRALSATLVVLALLTAASSPAAQAQAPADPATIAAATQAAQVWLAFVDGRDYSQSWEAAAPVLQEAVTKAAWTQAVTQARGPLRQPPRKERVGRRDHRVPPDGPVERGERREHLQAGDGLELGASELPGRPESEEAGIDQRRDQAGRQLTAAVEGRALGRHERGEASDGIE